MPLLQSPFRGLEADSVGVPSGRTSPAGPQSGLRSHFHKGVENCDSPPPVSTAAGLRPSQVWTNVWGLSAGTREEAAMRTIEIRPESVNPRTLRQVAEAMIERQAVIAYPTDTGYAFGCALGATNALKRIQRLKALGADYTWTLLCGDLNCLGTYARLENPHFRQIKRVVPG